MLFKLAAIAAIAASLASALPTTPLCERENEVWQPAVGASWQIKLNGDLDMAKDLKSNPSIVDIDLYNTEIETIQDLHSKGKKVICYFSAGTWEDYRPDSGEFNDQDLGNEMDGWPEYWLDVRSASVLEIMKRRIDLAAEKGCDAVDPDNMDGYADNNKSGFDFSLADSIEFLRAMSNHAVSRGLAIGLKNAADMVPEAVQFTHFVVNEQCHEYNECGDWQAYIRAGKPVFNVEYPEEAKLITNIKSYSTIPSNVLRASCGGQGAEGFSTVISVLSLDGWTKKC